MANYAENHSQQQNRNLCQPHLSMTSTIEEGQGVTQALNLTSTGATIDINNATPPSPTPPPPTSPDGKNIPTCNDQNEYSAQPHIHYHGYSKTGDAKGEYMKNTCEDNQTNLSNDNSVDTVLYGNENMSDQQETSKESVIIDPNVDLMSNTVSSKGVADSAQDSVNTPDVNIVQQKIAVTGLNNQANDVDNHADMTGLNGNIQENMTVLNNGTNNMNVNTVDTMIGLNNSDSDSELHASSTGINDENDKYMTGLNMSDQGVNSAMDGLKNTANDTTGINSSSDTVTSAMENPATHVQKLWISDAGKRKWTVNVPCLSNEQLYALKHPPPDWDNIDPYSELEEMSDSDKETSKADPPKHADRNKQYKLCNRCPKPLQHADRSCCGSNVESYKEDSNSDSDSDYTPRSKHAKPLINLREPSKSRMAAQKVS